MLRQLCVRSISRAPCTRNLREPTRPKSTVHYRPDLPLQPTFLNDFRDIARLVIPGFEISLSPNVRRIIEEVIRNKEWTRDDCKLFSLEFGPKETTTLAEAHEKLRSLNAVVSRLAELSIPLAPSVALVGLRLAAYGPSTQALNNYARLGRWHLPTHLPWDLNHSPYFVPVFETLQISVLKHKSKDWASKHQREELLALLTGPQVDGSFSNIYYPGDPIHRTVLIPLLSKLGGSPAILAIWGQIRANWASTKTKYPERYHRHFVVRDLVLALLANKDPKSAWDLAYDPILAPNEIINDIWDKLLDYPELCPDWERVPEQWRMRKAVKFLERAEHELGIVWTGKEGGKHVWQNETLKDWEELLKGGVQSDGHY